MLQTSVGMQGSEVYVMFRNHLHGNRDLYLAPSKDGGASFGAAQQLGNDNWPLEGCPMDGGALVINENGTPETVWRRRNKIYTCQHGHPEESIGEGNGCTIELINGKQVFAWTENGEVIIYTAGAKKNNLGKGQLRKSNITKMMTCYVYGKRIKIYRQPSSIYK